jgi:hypothetical protein
MKRELVQFARDVNSFCARLNDGLTAVAVLLGLLVVTVGAIRAQDFMPQVAAAIPADDLQSPQPLGR